jgi:hypothetical protein
MLWVFVFTGKASSSRTALKEFVIYHLPFVICHWPELTVLPGGGFDRGDEAIY